MYFVFCVAAVLSAVYLFFFFKRILSTFGADTKRTSVRIALIAAAVATGASTLNMFSFFGVAVLHIIAMALFAQFINFAVKLIAKTRYEKLKIWIKIYGSGALAIIFTAVFMFFGYVNLHNVRETAYTVNTEKQIRDGGYRIALLSDIHFGVSLDYNEFTEVCEEISAKEPDIVILCGDIVDNDTSKTEMLDVFKALGGIKSEFGIFYVHGNHDRPFSFRGLESEFTEDELITAIESNGITVLQDEIYEIAPDFVLAGRDDKSVASRKSAEDLLKDVDESKFILMLDHQPREYALTAATKTDLVLSGHTHGGQLWPLKQVQAVFNFNDEVYGHGFIDEDTQYIVTSGVAGWKYPIKTAAPAEYVIIDIS